MLIPKIEFEIYYKLNGNNLKKLNLSYCSNSKIDISIPVKIIEKDIDKYNSSSGYYNDMCYITISDGGTDITLKDRKDEFLDNNKTLCQENCLFSEYNYKIKKARCSCDVKEFPTKYENMKIDKTKLYENFIDIKNIANINLLVCYKVLFSKNGLLKNFGSYSIIGIIIVHFIIIIIYYSKNLYSQIQSIINKISFSFDNLELLNLPSKKNKNEERFEKNIYKKKSKKIKEQKLENKNVKKSKDLKRKSIKKLSKINKSFKKIRRFSTKITFENTMNFLNQIEETTGFSKNDNIFRNKSNSIKIDGFVKNVKNVLSYTDEELNNLEYKLALKYDKRKYCQYYYSLLKTKHALIFTFFNNTDYNSKIIKTDLFLFNFALFYIINALFFNDDTMHKIYKNKGAFDIIGQFPQIIYSFFISTLFSILLEMLALTEGIILQLKKIRSKNEFNRAIISIGKIIKIKILIYFIISSIFLIFFWYYISMFCAIYVNTQIHLINDTILSFVLSLIEPFGFLLIPGLFRIPSLSKKNNNKYILYRLSIIIQKIII